MEEKQITTKQQEILNNMAPTIVEKLGVDPAEVTMDAQFTNDLGADSLDSVELIMEFEKEFGVSIPDAQQEEIKTVGDVVGLIERMHDDPDWLPPVKSTQQPTASKVAGSKTAAKKPVATKPTKNVPADLLQTTVSEILKMPVAQALNLFDQIRSQMALRARAEKKK